MTHLRRAILILIVWLTFIYNLERVDFGTTNTVDLSSFVYVISFLATASAFLIPARWLHNRWVLLVAWLMIYGLGKLVLSQQRPILGDGYTYLSIAEATLIGITVWLGRELVLAIYDFEESVRNITLSNVSRRVKSLEQATDEIEVELVRSRRHNRPLAVMVVEIDEASIQARVHRAVQEIQQAMMARYVITKIAQIISNQLRRSDLIIDQHEQGRFIIFSPDTDSPDLDILIQRIQTATHKQLDIDLKIGQASFPEHALTFEELVDLAEQKITTPDQTFTISQNSPAKPDSKL